MPKDNSAARRGSRQHDAAIRQGQRDARTPMQQMALIGTRPGNSLRETSRLVDLAHPEAE